MNRISLFFIFIVAILFTGCGKSIEDTVKTGTLKENISMLEDIKDDWNENGENLTEDMRKYIQTLRDNPNKQVIKYLVEKDTLFEKTVSIVAFPDYDYLRKKRDLEKICNPEEAYCKKFLKNKFIYRGSFVDHAYFLALAKNPTIEDLIFIRPNQLKRIKELNLTKGNFKNDNYLNGNIDYYVKMFKMMGMEIDQRRYEAVKYTSYHNVYMLNEVDPGFYKYFNDIYKHNDRKSMKDSHKAKVTDMLLPWNLTKNLVGKIGFDQFYGNLVIKENLIKNYFFLYRLHRIKEVVNNMSENEIIENVKKGVELELDVYITSTLDSKPSENVLKAMRKEYYIEKIDDKEKMKPTARHYLKTNLELDDAVFNLIDALGDFKKGLGLNF